MTKANNIVIDRWNTLRLCKKAGLNFAWVLSVAGYSRNDFSKSAYIKVKGLNFDGQLFKKTTDVIESISSVINIQKSDISVNLSDYNLSGHSFSSYCCVDKMVVSEMCNRQDRSVMWLLNKLSITYNTYNQLTYVKIDKNGHLSSVIRPDKLTLLKMAGALNCTINDICINLENIKVR